MLCRSFADGSGSPGAMTSTGVATSANAISGALLLIASWCAVINTVSTSAQDRPAQHTYGQQLPFVVVSLVLRHGETLQLANGST